MGRLRPKPIILPHAAQCVAGTLSTAKVLPCRRLRGGMWPRWNVAPKRHQPIKMNQVSSCASEGSLGLCIMYVYIFICACVQFYFISCSHVYINICTLYIVVCMYMCTHIVYTIYICIHFTNNFLI